MQKIEFTRGQFALVNKEDYEFLNKWKWTCSDGYSYRETEYSDGKKRKLLMHRLLLGLQYGDKREGDHEDHNGLNNCKNNLRIADSTQNKANQVKTRGNSKYKGVHWDKRAGKWVSQIGFKKKKYFLGQFDEEIIAAQKYDIKAKELFGNFANTNF